MENASTPILPARRSQIVEVGTDAAPLACQRPSTAGTVSQRACVFCGSRVVLYPIADALHLVHGPVGCAAYTWDIRGALSDGPQLHRLSFSTDLREQDVIFGGEKKLRRALVELIGKYRPEAAFVYATCIVGLIGDDIEAVCRDVQRECGIPVLPVDSVGFAGTKKDGYRSACDALARLVGTGDEKGTAPRSINILGDFNIAGEIWTIREYFRAMGVRVIATITGDARVAHIRNAHAAALNIVQCSGSMTYLARTMQERYGIPFLRVSFAGIDDTAQALYDVAAHFADPAITDATAHLVNAEIAVLIPVITKAKKALTGKRAAVYTGGAFKAISLIKALRMVGMETVLVGSQTGNPDDYAALQAVCDPGTVIVDDATTMELASFVRKLGVDLFIGGVKERPIAYKLGVGFCDHNHERKISLAGFSGAANFLREVMLTVTSPVWKVLRTDPFGQNGEGMP